MKASRSQIERSLDMAAPDIRLFLLYGPDESSSRELAGRIAKSLGADAERVDLTGAQLKADPALLSDEAAAFAMFGGRRHIRVEPAGDEIIDAVEALLEANSVGNPVVVVAGALRKDAKLVKRALADPAAMAFASYAPEGQDADRIAIAIGRDHGLRIPGDVATRLAGATGGDRALLTREIEKLALFVDAAPEHPRELTHDALDLLGADSEDGDLSRLVDAVLEGRGDDAEAEIARLASEGISGVPIVRAGMRRLLMLAQVRDGGGGGRPLYGSEKEHVGRQAARWTPAMLATAIARLAQAGRLSMSSGGPGPLAVEAELIALSRVAARRR